MKCYDASCGIKVILLLLAWVICGEAAALPPGASADYILDDAVKSYNNSESLPVELKRIRDLSLQLLQRLTADGKLAGAAELAQIASSDKQYVSTLDAARRVAEERPTLPVLARRILFAQLLLKYLEQGKASLNDQQEQEIFELAKGVSGHAGGRQGKRLGYESWGLGEALGVGLGWECVWSGRLGQGVGARTSSLPARDSTCSRSLVRSLSPQGTVLRQLPLHRLRQTATSASPPYYRRLSLAPPLLPPAPHHPPPPLILPPAVLLAPRGGCGAAGAARVPAHQQERRNQFQHRSK